MLPSCAQLRGDSSTSALFDSPWNTTSTIDAASDERLRDAPLARRNRTVPSREPTASSVPPPEAFRPTLSTRLYFHFPYFDSLAEALLKPEDKGVVAAFSPSGLSLNAPAHRYHQLLLEELLGGHRLGDAVLAAQKRYADSGAFPELLRIYHLFGDPATTLDTALSRGRSTGSHTPSR